MGFLLFTLAFALYDILIYLKLNHFVKINIFTRIFFHVIESIIMIYSFYVMYGDTSNLIYSIIFVILFLIPLSEYRIVRSKKSDFR